MISIANLFELVSTVNGVIPASKAPPAQNPMGEVNQYYQQRLASLKKMAASGRLNQQQYIQMMNELRKNKFNRGFGTVTF